MKIIVTNGGEAAKNFFVHSTFMEGAYFDARWLKAAHNCTDLEAMHRAAARVYSGIDDLKSVPDPEGRQWFHYEEPADDWIKNLAQFLCMGMLWFRGESTMKTNIGAGFEMLTYVARQMISRRLGSSFTGWSDGDVRDIEIISGSSWVDQDATAQAIAVFVAQYLARWTPPYDQG